MTLWERVEALTMRVGALEDKLNGSVLIESEPPVVSSLLLREFPLEDPEPCSCDEAVVLKAALNEAYRLAQVAESALAGGHDVDALTCNSRLVAFLARARIATQEP